MGRTWAGLVRDTGRDHTSDRRAVQGGGSSAGVHSAAYRASYRSVAFDLYTFEIADQARYRSGALTNPFSRLVGIVGEFGLVGSVLVFAFVLALAREGYRLWRTEAAVGGFRAAGATLGFAMPLFVVLGIFDSYFEQPDLTGALAVLALVVVGAAETTREPA